MAVQPVWSSTYRTFSRGDVREVQDADFDAFSGLRIDSVAIDNRNVYDLNNPKYSTFIFRTIDKLHFTTKQSVIRRELLFAKGDRLDPERIEESARNLRKRLMLLDAWMEIDSLKSGGLMVTVVTVDAWSLETSFSINRSGKDIDYKAGIDERNLLGNNQQVTLDVVTEKRETTNPAFSRRDQQYIIWSFGDPRFLGLKQSLFLGYSNNDRNSYSTISFGRPYYDLRQDWRYEITAIDQKGRRDYYHDGLQVAEAKFKTDGTVVGVSKRFGPTFKKLRTNLGYNYRYEQALGQFEIPQSGTTIIFPGDSAYHELSLSVRGSIFNFVELDRIDGIGFTEDFVTGTSLMLGVGKAYRHDFNGYYYHRLFGEFSRQWYSRGNLAGFQLDKVVWINDGHRLRDQFGAEVKYYNNVLDYFTLAVSGDYQSDWFADGRELLNLGGTDGLRGFDSFYRSGNRRAVLNMEARFYPGIEILSALLGAVIFVDAGRTFKADENLTLAGLSTGVGAGLRIHLPRFGRERVVRIDCGYSDDYGWQVSVGANQYFNAALSSLSLTNL